MASVQTTLQHFVSPQVYIKYTVSDTSWVETEDLALWGLP